jgi:hypothetical protein
MIVPKLRVTVSPSSYKKVPDESVWPVCEADIKLRPSTASPATVNCPLKTVFVVGGVVGGGGGVIIGVVVEELLLPQPWRDSKTPMQKLVNTVFFKLILFIIIPY